MAKKLGTKVDPRSIALGAELRAQIAGSEYKNMTRFADALNATEPDGVVHYTTLTQMVGGTEPITMKVLFPALDLLGVEWDEFVVAAKKRTPQGD